MWVRRVLSHAFRLEVRREPDGDVPNPVIEGEPRELVPPEAEAAHERDEFTHRERLGRAEIAPRRGGGVHGADVRLRDIPHVDEAPRQSHHAGVDTAQQIHQHLVGGVQRPRQAGSDDEERVDRHEVPCGRPLANEFPRRALGQRLREVVRVAGQCRPLVPVGLGEHAAVGFIRDRRHGRREDDAADARRTRARLEHRARAPDGGIDEVALRILDVERIRARHVEHDVAAPDVRVERSGRGERRLHELEAVARAGQLAQERELGRSRETPHRAADAVAGVEKLPDRLRRDEAGSAADEHRVHETIIQTALPWRRSSDLGSTGTNRTEALSTACNRTNEQG